jgi:tetratricopeptide (TPR) repeat protein
MTKEKTEPQVSLEDVEVALTKAEKFIEDNKKILIIVASAIIIVIGGIFLYKKVYLANKEDEAQKQMFVAEQYFEKDSFNLALNGNGSYPGFLEIIDDYGVTNSANLAHYYAGISFLRLGKFEDAIEQLKHFKTNDLLIAPICLGALGDAYVEKGKLQEGVEYYVKAYNKNQNDITSPVYLMKAGQVYEDLGEYQKAIDTYKEIKKNYLKTSEGRQVDKYITRASLELETKGSAKK